MKSFAPLQNFLPGMLLGAFSLAETAPAQNTTEWRFHKTADGSHPTAAEQQLLWLLNRARSDPPAEGAFLAATGDETTEFAIDYFQVDVARMRREFSAIAPKSPAAFDSRLYEASRQHSEFMASNDVQTHDGQIERVNNNGFSWSAIRLNVFAYADNPIYCHASLNIDIGGPASEGGMQAGRGHRMGIMSSDPALPALSNVGFAFVPENNNSTEVGPNIFSGAYASAQENSADSFNRFVVGTVWNDLNRNGRYDEGEGLNGVRVQLEPGAWHAVTGAAGGYAIPVITPGTYRVTFSGGTFPGSFVRSLTVGEVSVLSDAEISSLPVTDTPFTAFLNLNPAGGLTLSWSGGKAPWQVQRSSDPAQGWQNFGAPTSERSLNIPFDGSSGFFRVVASP